MRRIMIWIKTGLNLDYIKLYFKQTKYKIIDLKMIKTGLDLDNYEWWQSGQIPPWVANMTFMLKLKIYFQIYMQDTSSDMKS